MGRSSYQRPNRINFPVALHHGKTWDATGVIQDSHLI